MIDTPRRVPRTALRSSPVQLEVHAPACGRECGPEHGFALITVLWLITALVSIVGLSLSAVRLGNQATTNRIILARGRWAAEACLAITQARWAEHRFADTTTIVLGRGARCAWEVSDPSARVNLNTADPEVLRALGLSEAFVRASLARRRRGTIEDLSEVSTLNGFDSTYTGLITVTGLGVVNLATASRQVLLALPGMTPEGVDLLTYRRTVRLPVTSLDAMAADLSPTARAALLNRYADLARVTTFSAPQVLVHATGWVEGFAPHAAIEELTVPLPERLAVVRRRMW